MHTQPIQPPLLKFLLLSAFSFFIGTTHGVLQVIPAVRVWLDSIGSPYGGPGHMIDPLAHAHINLVGGVVLLVMGATYYLLPIFSGKPLYSWRMVNHTFWWTAGGVYYFYTAQMIFGVWEGLLLTSNPAGIPAVHKFYGPIIASSGMIMEVGFLIYMLNIILTVRSAPKSS
jgi:cytochrome c oxidase cbb3-type subunit 1